MVDLSNISRRWRLPRCQHGDALQLPHGCRLVRWGDYRLAVTGNDAGLIRSLRGVALLEYSGINGATASFTVSRLGSVLELLESSQKVGKSA